MTNAADSAEIDKRTARWLRKRHPRWPDEQIDRLITRTHVIDAHPNWTNGEVDDEIAARERDKEALAAIPRPE
jgi:hypothetical protein